MPVNINFADTKIILSELYKRNYLVLINNTLKCNV